MTQFTTDPIETLVDWNAVLVGGCCCEMPGCPEPTTECESISNELCGHRLPSHPSNTTEEGCLVFKTKTTVQVYTLIDSYPGEDEDGPNYSINQVETGTLVTDYAFADGVCESTSNSTFVSDYTELNPVATFGVYVYTKKITWAANFTRTGSGDWVKTGTYTEQDIDFADDSEDGEITTLTDDDMPVSPGTVTHLSVDSSWTKTGFVYSKTISADTTATVTYSNPVGGASALAGLEFPDDANGILCESVLTCEAATKVRFRWVIPDTFGGSYCKISWDILTEPDGWDDPSPSVFRSLTPGVPWEWTGPGDPAVPDSWKSGWYDLDPPTTPGTRRPVNARRECYRGPFGSRPEYFGETIAESDL